MFGTALTKLSGLAGKLLGIGGLAAAGGVAAEELTDDGQGGWLSRWYHRISKKVIEATSIEQARNSTIDSYYGGMAKVYGFIGAIGALISAIPGLEGMGKSIQTMFEGKIKEMNEQAVRFKQGDVFPTTRTPSGDALIARGQQAAADAGTAVAGATRDATAAVTPVAEDIAQRVRDNPGGAAVVAGGSLLGLAALKNLVGGLFSSGAGRAAGGLLGGTSLGRAALVAGALGTAGYALSNHQGAGAPAPTGAGGTTSTTAVTPTAITAPGAATAAPLIDPITGATIDPTTAHITPSAVAPSTTAAAATTATTTPAAGVSLLQDPLAWGGDLIDGAKSLLKETPDGYRANWDVIRPAAANNAKAAGLGLSTTFAWLAGQAVDTVTTATNFLDIGNVQTDYSTKWSQDMAEGVTYAMQEYAGGAPDLKGAWAQTANVGVPVLVGGFAVKGLQAAGWAARTLGSVFSWNAATTSAATAAPAAAAARAAVRPPAPGMRVTP